MITDGEKWHYLADGIILYSFRTGNKLKSHEDISKNQDYCHLKMPDEHNYVLKFNH